MTAVVPLGLARAIYRHAAASRRADAALARGSGDIDAALEEGAAMDGQAEALAALSSADNAVVVAQAYRQGAREAELGLQVAILKMLMSALAGRAFGGPLAA